MSLTGEGNEHRTLVLFTWSFPFGSGEPFLEAEIGHLANTFQRVLIVPVGGTGKPAGRRTVPPRVTVIPPPQRDVGLSTILFGIRHPIRFGRLIWRTLNESGSYRQKIAWLKFSLREEMRTREILPRLRQLLLQDHDTPLFYAYWLHLPVAVAARARTALRHSATPIVARAHRFDIYGEDPDGFLPHRERVLSEVDKVYAVSEAGAAHLRQRWPRHAEKVSVARLGTPAARSTNSATNATAIVRSCSRIVPFKRVPLLIESLAALQQRGINVFWEHIGPINDAYAREVKAVADERLESGSFIFMGGMSNADVREWHATRPAAVFVNVSESEGVPVSILEAIAHGLPVIATDVGGSSETIDTELGMFGGLVSAAASPEEIAHKIAEVLTASSDEFERYSRSSVEHWKNRWASEKNFSEFAESLRSIHRATG